MLKDDVAEDQVGGRVADGREVERVEAKRDVEQVGEAPAKSLSMAGETSNASTKPKFLGKPFRHAANTATDFDGTAVPGRASAEEDRQIGA